MNKLQPKNKEELKEIIEKEITLHGKDCSLNHVDTSLITDMSELFTHSSFNGDISQWNTSNVKNMVRMFYYCDFNSDISKWDVSNVTEMYCMFYYSNFNSDISQWNTSNVKDMGRMFYNSSFNGDISQWNVINVTDMYAMFYNSNFNGDISKWNVKRLEFFGEMFEYCKAPVPGWHIEDNEQRKEYLKTIDEVNTLQNEVKQVEVVQKKKFKI